MPFLYGYSVRVWVAVVDILSLVLMLYISVLLCLAVAFYRDDRNIFFFLRGNGWTQEKELSPDSLYGVIFIHST